MAQTFRPSQVGEFVKKLMEDNPVLKNITVEGEVTSYLKHSSGHHYFTLKDTNGALKCVLFRGNATSLNFTPKNGMSVLASGQVTVYPQTGQCQLVCRRLAPLGVGDLHQAFLDMQEKLEREGLFEERFKKNLPYLPKKVGILTSRTGAVVHDMLQLLETRCPMVPIVVVPVPVQGEGAAREIANAIAYVNEKNLCDVMIVGRGGGSPEDLWAFNEEVLARAIFNSRIPVVSAVGHEPDVSISDYVADRRASTPSHATELVVPDGNRLKQWLSQQEVRLNEGLKNTLTQKRQQLQYVTSCPQLKDPRQAIWAKSQQVDHMEERLRATMASFLQGKTGEVGRLAASLHALSPLEVMGRGYAIPRSETGKVVSSVADTAVGEKISLWVQDGVVQCRIEEICKENESNP